MSLLTLLQNFNISAETLKGFKPEDVIRLEKRLRAEARLNESLEVGQMEEVLDAIKNYGVELRFLLSDDFKGLRKVLENPTKFIIDKREVNLPWNVSHERFATFLESCFYTDLEAYIENCVQQGYYNALLVLLEYRPVFSYKLLDLIQHKLGQKLNYAAECISINASDLVQKVNFATNPNFYRCLNAIGAAHFENDARTLVNAAVDRLRGKDLLWFIVLAISEFNPMSDRFKEWLREHKEIAVRKGVREVLVDPRTKKRTGGVSIGVKSQPQQTATEKEEKRSGKNVALYIVIALVLVFIFLFNQGGKEERYDNDYLRNFTEVEENHYTSSPEVITVSKDSDLKPTLKYLHSEDVEILEIESIPFTTEASLLNETDEFPGGVDNVRIVNKTNSRALIILKSAEWERCELVEPGGSFVASSITRGFRVYMGDDPQLVTHINEGQDTITHFRFGECSDEQYDQFLEFFNIHRSFYEGSRYVLEITYDTELDFEVYD